jgi:transcriptional regulator with XRE-family HTH domain
VPSAPSVTAPTFGEILKEIRGAASLGEFANRLRTFAPGLKLNRTNIEKWENGRVPNWIVLGAYSAISKRPLRELAQALAVDLVDRVCPGTDQGSGFLSGEPDAPHARLLESDAALRARLAHCEAALDKVPDVMAALAAIAEAGRLGGQTGTARQGPTASRGRRRTAS